MNKDIQELSFTGADLQWVEQRKILWNEIMAEMAIRYSAMVLGKNGLEIIKNKSGGEQPTQQGAAGDAENDNLAR